MDQPPFSSQSSQIDMEEHKSSLKMSSPSSSAESTESNMSSSVVTMSSKSVSMSVHVSVILV